MRVAGTGDAIAVRALLREQLLALVDPGLDRSLDTAPSTAEDGTTTPAIAMTLMNDNNFDPRRLRKYLQAIASSRRVIPVGGSERELRRGCAGFQSGT